jgi:transcription initiation factor TFIIB
MQTLIVCSICGKAKGKTVIIDPESGEIICSNCGMVISDKVQDMSRPEWRAFSAEEVNDRCRTGAPTSLARYDRGLYTIIGRTDKDGAGHKLDASTYSTIKSLRAWDFRTQSRTATAINLMQAFNELDVLSDKLALPDAVVEKTAYIYRKAQRRGLVRGRSINALLAASAYIACREVEIPRTLRDIAAVDQMKCIAKVANIANLSEKTKRQAISIMNEVRKKEEILLLSAGKNPMGFAATILYLSSINIGENITQNDIAQAAGVTEVTLRNRLKDLKSKLKLSN